MDSRESLITKLSRKKVITPYEAIHLQYLDKQHIKQQIPDVQKWKNIYIAGNNISGIVKPYQLDSILSFQSKQDESLYDSYRWAASTMFHLDNNIGDIAYKGIALINELRYMQGEYIKKVMSDMREHGKVEGEILEFSAFSHVHQQVMTIQQVLESYASNFRYMIMTVDNILTLNYYIHGMVELEEFKSIKLLQIWIIGEPVEDEDDKPINYAALCHAKTIDIVEDNHPKFITYMKGQLSSFGIDMDYRFGERSLEYVKNSLSEVLEK